MRYMRVNTCSGDIRLTGSSERLRDYNLASRVAAGKKACCEKKRQDGCSVSFYLATILIVTLFFSGAMVNYLPWLNTVLLIAGEVIALLVFSQVDARDKTLAPRRAYVWWIVAYSIYIVAVLLSFFSGASYLSQYNTTMVSYLFAPLAFYAVSIALSNDEKQLLKRILIGLSAFAAVFGFVQVFFRSYLPTSALLVNGTTIVNELMLAGDSSYVRANGLIGNAIEFADLTAMFCLVCLSSKTFKSQKANIALCALFLVANTLSSSRATIVLIVVFVFVKLLLNARIRAFSKVALMVALIMGVCIYLYAASDSLLVQRLLGLDETASASSAQHSDDIARILGVISQNLLFGTGVCSQYASSNPIITDGWFFQLTAELGVFGLVAYYLLVFATYRLVKTPLGHAGLMQNPVTLVVLLFVICSFFNSGFIGRVPYFAFFIYLACETVGGRCYSRKNGEERGRA